MGNTNKIESENRQLQIRNRLLERKAHVGAGVGVGAGAANSEARFLRNKILDVKKNHKYTNLVFDGDTIKSFSHVGALGYLHDKHYLSDICNIACSSFSTFFAVLYAVGYSPPEIKTIAESIDLLQDEPLASDIFHVGTEDGKNNGQHLMNIITELIEEKTGRKHYNLSDLQREKGINLVVAVADISRAETLLFCPTSYPKMPLRIVVRMACSTPPIYAPVIFDGHYLVDNIIIGNSLITTFDESYAPNPYTLCLSIIGNVPRDDDLSIKHKDRVSYVSMLVDTMLSNKYEDEDPRRITINVPNYPLEHNITMTQRRELMNLGYNCTREWSSRIT
jgi:predicted acylesterase/phospholipase RssA